MSSYALQEARAAYDSGYICSVKQLACACGKIQGDPTQTIGSGQTATVEIKSIRFDDDETPMVDLDNHRIMLVNSQKVYNISVNIQAQISEANVVQNTLSLIWFDGETEKEVASIDIMNKENSTTQNYQLATLVKSNDQRTEDKNNNYICVKLRNKGNATLSISRFRFSAVRCV